MEENNEALNKQLMQQIKDYKELCKILLDNQRDANNVNNKTLKITIITAFISLIIISSTALYFYFNQDTSFNIDNKASATTEMEE